MYWREYLVLFSLAAVLAHASPGQDAGAALANANPSGGLIVSTFMIKGKPMTATVVGSRAEPTPNVQDSKIYFPVVGPNNIDDPLYNPCARMVKNLDQRTSKTLGGRCQHIADKIQLPPLEHFLSLCDAGYHWPLHSEFAKLRQVGHRHEIQLGLDPHCRAMYQEREQAARWVGTSSLALNCYFCHNSTLVREIEKEQLSYVRDGAGNIQNNYNFKTACSWYKELDDKFNKGLTKHKRCVRVERGGHH